jgi:hypothetical protein
MKSCPNSHLFFNGCKQVLDDEFLNTQSRDENLRVGFHSVPTKLPVVSFHYVSALSCLSS